jgi:hypothetical protein
LRKSELQLTNHPPRELFEAIHVPRNLYKLLHDLLPESYGSFSLVGSGDPIAHHQWSYDCVKTGASERLRTTSDHTLSSLKKTYSVHIVSLNTLLMLLYNLQQSSGEYKASAVLIMDSGVT